MSRQRSIIRDDIWGQILYITSASVTLIAAPRGLHGQLNRGDAYPLVAITSTAPTTFYRRVCLFGSQNQRQRLLEEGDTAK